MASWPEAGRKPLLAAAELHPEALTDRQRLSDMLDVVRASEVPLTSLTSALLVLVLGELEDAVTERVRAGACLDVAVEEALSALTCAVVGATARPDLVSVDVLDAVAWVERGISAVSGSPGALLDDVSDVERSELRDVLDLALLGSVVVITELTRASRWAPSAVENADEYSQLVTLVTLLALRGIARDLVGSRAGRPGDS